MIAIENILMIVEQELGVSLEQMLGPKKNEVIDARNIASMIILEEGYSGTVVTDLFQRHRTTIYTTKRVFNAHIMNDKNFKIKYLACIKRITELEENES